MLSRSLPRIEPALRAIGFEARPIQKKKLLGPLGLKVFSGGEDGIRTHGAVTRTLP